MRKATGILDDELNPFADRSETDVGPAPGDREVPTGEVERGGAILGDPAALAALVVASAMDFAIVTSTPEGIINSWSPGAENIMGWSAAEAVGQPVGLFFTPEDRRADEDGREMARARATGCATDERWHMRKDGTRFWASGELQPLRDGGNIVGFVKILRDRTAARQLQERLEAAEAQAAEAQAQASSEEKRLRELFAAAPGFMAVLRGPDHVFDLTNASYMQLIGHRDVLGRGVREALPEVEGQGFFELLDRVYATGERVTLDQISIMLERRPGAPPEQRFVTLVYEPMRNSAGEVIGIFVEGFDGTDAARAHAAAQAIAAEHKAVLGQLAEAVIIADAAGRISFVNQAAERLHGVARLDVEPTDYSEAYHLLTEGGEPYPSAELPLARAVLRGETVLDARWRIRRPDGSEVLAIGNAQPVMADGAQLGAVLTVRDDTARTEAEQALKENRAYLRLMLDSTQEAFYSVDTNGVTQSCNAAFVNMLGFAREEEALGRTLHGVIHHSHPDGAHYAVEDCPIYICAKTGQPAHVTDEVFYRLDGTSFPVDYRVAPIIHEGTLRGAICTFADVTEQRRDQRRLRESETRAQRVLENMGEGFLTLDREFRVLSINAEGLRIDGRPREEIIGRPWLELWPEAEQLPNLRLMQDVMASGVAGSLEYQHRSEVVDVWLETRVYPMEGGLAVFYRDITERRRAEERVRLSETRYRTLFDAIDAGFCILELKFDDAGRALDYRMVEINPAFERQTGLVGAAGKWVRDVVDIEQHWVDLYGEVALSREPRRLENGSAALGRWFDVYAFPVETPEARRVAVLFTDISNRKQTEHELREQARTLETLNQTGAALAGELDLERLVGRVTDAGSELIGASMGAFFYNVLNEAGESFMLYTLSGASREDFEGFGMPRATAIFHPTFVGEGPIRSDDITRDPRYGQSEPHRGMPEGHLPVRSFLAVSVIGRSGEVIGGLFYGHPEPGRFNERHEQLLVGIAAQAAISIDNARLFEAAQRELSERSKAEEALRELNRTLETRVAETVAERDMIWRTSQDLFLVCGLDGFYRSVNPAWIAGLGYTPEELVGVRFDKFAHPEDLAAATKAFTTLSGGEPVNELDIRMLHKNGGYRWFSWIAVPHRDVFAASGRDVQARMELEEQLRQSQKMEAVGQLTGGIAHDFNNLLTIVSGNIEMARRSLGADGDPRTLRSLGNAAKGADRAAALTQRLLAFSRRQPLQPRATDINKLVTGMTELLDRALGETVELQVVAGAGLWRVEVDPNQLENAILNLAVNARDAMPAGGKLTIETTNSSIDEAYAAAQREVAPGQYVLISVTDTGEGMQPDTVAKAFDPFFSTKDVGKGTGLGLSQVYGYVKQSGGHVKIYSEPGQGTTIKLYLPRLVADMNAAEEDEVDAGPALQGQESILVVEDDDDVRIYTVDSLRELGYRVLEAHDGASALRLLERQEDAPRLLLTDVVMPGMSGRELADRARDAWPDMRVLFTTGYARNAIVHGGRLDPGVELLPKPFTFEALAAKVRQVLEKSSLERALVLDPSEDSREPLAAALARLGFEPEVAATVREALGKLRTSGGMFDVVLLADTLPVGNLDAVITEIHAVRSDLPVLLLSESSAPHLANRYAGRPCIGVMAASAAATELHEHLGRLRVSCRNAYEGP